jgi:hypothetical protein
MWAVFLSLIIYSFASIAGLWHSSCIPILAYLRLCIEAWLGTY